MTLVTTTTGEVEDMHLPGGCGEEVLRILKVGDVGGQEKISDKVQEGV